MTRIKNDAYMTDPRLAKAIVIELSRLIPTPNTVLEPSSGSGSFVHALEVTTPGSKITAIDISDGCDFTKVQSDFFGLSNFDLVIGNPPYSLADEFVDKALSMGVTVAFLLRTGFLHSQKRSKDLWAKRMLKWLIPIAQRPSFTGDGKTDSTEYSVFVWQTHFHGDAKILKPLWWR